MIDHVADRNHAELHKLQFSMEIPDFVKEASLATPDDVKSLSADHFASPDKTFPIHTKADTWASIAFFHKQASAIPAWQKEAIATNLVKAAKFWQLEDAFKRVAKPMAKEASDTLTIAYVDDQGITRHEVKVATPEGFQKLATDLVQNWRNYPYTTRKAVAKQLHSSLDKFAQALTDKEVVQLEKVAGMQKTHRTQVDKVIGQYKAWCHHARRADLIPSLDKAAEALTELSVNGIVHEDALDKIASILDNVDHLAKLHVYSTAPCAPEMAFNGMTMKNAQVASKNMAKLANGEVVLMSKVAANGELIREFAKEALGLDIRTMGDLQKVAADDAELICKAFPTLMEA